MGLHDEPLIPSHNLQLQSVYCSLGGHQRERERTNVCLGVGCAPVNAGPIETTLSAQFIYLSPSNLITHIYLHLCYINHTFSVYTFRSLKACLFVNFLSSLIFPSIRNP